MQTEIYTRWMDAVYPFDMAPSCRNCVTQHFFGCTDREHAPLVAAAKSFYEAHSNISAQTPEQESEILAIRQKYDWMFRKPTFFNRVLKFVLGKR